MFASRVVSTEEFIEMSHDAQALYFHLLADTQTDGELVNALMVVRAKGFSRDNLEELFQNGYLLRCDGKVYVTHAWVNNKYSAKVWAAMDSCQPYLDGILEFEGIEGKSAYRLSDTKVTPSSHPSDPQKSPEHCRNDNQQSASSSRSGTEYTCNCTQQQQSENVEVGVTGEGDSSETNGGSITEGMTTCPNKACGARMRYHNDKAHSWGHCDRCGKDWDFVGYRWSEVQK
jgi:hypothetical protein